jgi:hypothetical protein
MKKIILGVIILIVVILISVSAVFFISTETNLIPGNDEPGSSEPDSNPDTDVNDVTIGIRFDEPSSDYSIPEVTNYHSIPIKGTVYGTNLNKIYVLCFCWHDNIEYGRIFVGLGETADLAKCVRYDDYNYIWETRMFIMQLGSGNHVLRARALDQDSNVLAEATINIKIPDKYVYRWDSRSPKFSDAYQSGGYYYSFSMPYETFFTPEPRTDLQGNIIKVKGQVHVNTYKGWPDVVELKLWNGYTKKWTTVPNTFIHVQGTGWFDIDVNCNEKFASWISFVGPSTIIIDGFVGEVWVAPGTVNPSVSVLDILMGGLFNDFDNPPYSE